MTDHRLILSKILANIAGQIDAYHVAGVHPSLTDLGRLATALHHAAASAKLLEERAGERAVEEMKRIWRRG